MQKQSEVVLQHLESTAEVVASVDAHGEVVAARLDERLALHQENLEDGPTPANSLGMMTRLKDGLVDSQERLADADHQHVEQLRKVLELREKRDEARPRMQQQLTTARHLFEEMHGQGTAFVVAGLESPTAKTVTKLLRQADLAIARCEQPDLVLPPSRVAGFKVDPVEVANGLKAESGQLKGTLGEIRLARRKAQETRKVKNRVLEEHKVTFLWTARTLEGFYRLAGEDELADRIRPSVRRPGRRSVDVGEGSEEPAAEQTAPEGSEPVPAPATGAEDGSTEDSVGSESGAAPAGG